MGLVGQLFRLELDGPDGDVDRDRQDGRAHRRRPLRRDRAQHVRPRGELLRAALDPHDDRAPGRASTRSTTPRPRTRCCCSKTCRRAGRLLDQVAGCSVRDARPAIAALASCTRASGTTRARRRGRLLRARRRSVSRRGRVRVRHRVAARAGVLPRGDHDRVRAFGDAYAAQIPALFAKLSRGAARARPRRLAARQPVLHARRRRDRGRLAAHRPLGRPARPRRTS